MKTASSLPNRQGGAASLLVALILLVGITLISLFTARSAVIEQQISGNEYRAKQAFEAADAGLNYALAYLDNGGPDHDDDGSPDTIACLDSSNGLAAGTTARVSLNLILDFDAGTSAISEGETLSGGTSGATGTVASVNLSSGSWAGGDATGHLTLSGVSGTFQDNEAITTASGSATASGDTGMVNIRVISEGRSEAQCDGTDWASDTKSDKAVRRTVMQDSTALPPLANVPNQPVVAKGDAILTGNITVTNTETNATVWAGGNIDTSGSGATTISMVDGTQVENSGVDLIASDNNLSGTTDADLFKSIFGDTVDNVVSKAAGLSESGGGIMAYKCDTASGETSYTLNGGTYGSSTKPAFIIIDCPDFQTAGNLTVNGLIYTTGNMTAAGTVTVNGSIVTAGNFSVGTGNVSVNYSSSILNTTPSDGDRATLAGTWRDW